MPGKKTSSTLFCLVCRGEIPPDRLRHNAPVTCGNAACAKELRKRRTAILELNKCRFCGKPSSPEERREFNAWRKARGDKKKRGRRPKYPVPDPRQIAMPNDLFIQ